MGTQSILKIIEKHNDVVHFIGSCEVTVPAHVIFALMPLSSSLARLGLEITQQARELGLDVKCCMQSGEIITGSAR